MTKPVTAKPMKGILVIMGAASGVAKTSFDAYWAAAKKQAPSLVNQTVTYVSSATSIKNLASVASYKLMWIAGSAPTTGGGITDAINSALLDKSGMIVDWVTRFNGSVIYMGQTDLPRKAYAALNMGGTKLIEALQVTKVPVFGDVSITPEAHIMAASTSNTTYDIRQFKAYFTRKFESMFELQLTYVNYV